MASVVSGLKTISRRFFQMKKRGGKEKAHTFKISSFKWTCLTVIKSETKWQFQDLERGPLSGV